MAELAEQEAVRGKHDEEIMATTGEPVVCDVRTERP